MHCIFIDLPELCFRQTYKLLDTQYVIVWTNHRVQRGIHYESEKFKEAQVFVIISLVDLNEQPTVFTLLCFGIRFPESGFTMLQFVAVLPIISTKWRVRFLVLQLLLISISVNIATKSDTTHAVYQVNVFWFKQCLAD